MGFDLKKVFAILVLLLFTAIIFLPLVGCGTRKSESQKKEEISKQDFSGLFRNSGNSFEFLDFQSNLKINSISVFDEENETTTVKKSYSPINSAVLATFIDENGRRQELNNANFTEEKKTEKNKKKSQKSEKSEKGEKAKSEKKAISKSDVEIKKKDLAKKVAAKKKVDQQQWKFPLWLLLLIILIVFSVLAYLNKRFDWVKHVTAFVSRLFQFRKK